MLFRSPNSPTTKFTASTNGKANVEGKKLPKWYIDDIEEGSWKEKTAASKDGMKERQSLKDKDAAQVHLALSARVFVKEETKAFEESNQNSKKRTAKKEECNCNMKYET